jgi:hypothetical protein
MDATPYTCLLLEAIQKLRNSSSSSRLTWLPSTGEAAAHKLPLLFAVHDCDDDADDDDADDDDYDDDADDDDDDADDDDDDADDDDDDDADDDDDDDEDDDDDAV